MNIGNVLYYQTHKASQTKENLLLDRLSQQCSVLDHLDKLTIKQSLSTTRDPPTNFGED